MKFHVNSNGAVVYHVSATRKVFIQKEDLEELRALLRREGAQGKQWVEDINTEREKQIEYGRGQRRTA